MMTTLQLLNSTNKPTLLLASRMGSLYNLIPSNYNKVEAIHLSVGDFIHIKEDVLEKLPQSISFKKYLGYPESIITYLAPHDFYKLEKQIEVRVPKHHREIPGQKPKEEKVEVEGKGENEKEKRHKKNKKQGKQQNKQPVQHQERQKPQLTEQPNSNPNKLNFISMLGCGQDNTVKVFSNKGYQKLTDKQYYQMVQLIKPDIWVAFTDMPIQSNKTQTLSKKSILKGIKKSTDFLEMLESQQQPIPGLLLAPIHGINTQYLIQSILQTLKYQHIISGFLICDIFQSTSNQQIISVINTIKQHTGEEDKKFLICLAGEGRIGRLELFQEGVNMFEVNYPFRLAEENKALVGGQEKVPVQLEVLSPLEKGCECLACRKYSESYIAHLIKCHEMTANVLLTMHNLEQYTRVGNKY